MKINKLSKLKGIQEYLCNSHVFSPYIPATGTVLIFEEFKEEFFNRHYYSLDECSENGVDYGTFRGITKIFYFGDIELQVELCGYTLDYVFCIEDIQSVDEGYYQRISAIKGIKRTREYNIVL